VEVRPTTWTQNETGRCGRSRGLQAQPKAFRYGIGLFPPAQPIQEEQTQAQLAGSHLFRPPKEGKRRAIHQYPPSDDKKLRGKPPRSWSYLVEPKGIEPLTS